MPADGVCAQAVAAPAPLAGDDERSRACHQPDALGEATRQALATDERPLPFDEVLRDVHRHEEMREPRLDWPTLSRHGMIAARVAWAPRKRVVLMVKD